MTKAKKQVRSTPRVTSTRDHVVRLRIRPETKRALDELARTQQRTRVAVVRMLLEDATGTVDD